MNLITSLFFYLLYYIAENIFIVVFSLIGLYRIGLLKSTWAWYRAGVVGQGFVLFGMITEAISNQGLYPLHKTVVSVCISVFFIALFYYATNKFIQMNYESPYKHKDAEDNSHGATK